MDNLGQDNKNNLANDIAATRARIGSELNELSDRVKPDALSEGITQSAKDALNVTQEAVLNNAHSLNDAVARQLDTAGSKLIESISKNPLPAALIGLGIGFLALRSKKAALVQENHQDLYDGKVEQPKASHDESLDQHGQEVDDVFPLDAHNPQQFREGKSDHQRRVISLKTDRQVNTLNSEVEGLGVTNKAPKQGTNKVTDFVEKQPLLAGGIALVTGLAFATLLPSTQQEKRTLAKQSQALIDGVKEKSTTIAEQIKTSAEDAVENVQEAGQELPVFVHNSKEGLSKTLREVAAKSQATVKEIAQHSSVNL